MPCTARDETEAQRWGQGLDDTQLGLGDSRRASPGKAQSPDFSGRWGHKLEPCGHGESWVYSTAACEF